MAPCPHEALITKLATRCVLDDDDKDAVYNIACTSQTIPAHKDFIKEDRRPENCHFLLSGFACRYKTTSSGMRQIIAILLPGDFTDLQQLFLTRADHSVQSLTNLQVAEIAVPSLRELVMARPNIGRALWVDALVEASITRELAVNLGRRDGITRIAHFLCTLEARLAIVGLAENGFVLPMTQFQIGDATGLTSVHVNRIVQQLERDGFIERSGTRKRNLKIIDRQRLWERADFTPIHLHIDQATFALPGDHWLNSISSHQHR